MACLPRFALAASLALLATACGSSKGSGAADLPEAVTDVLNDAPADVPPADIPADVPADVPADIPADGLPADAGPTEETGPSVFPAVPGARCAPGSLVGEVQVAGNPWGPGLDAAGGINDRPDPFAPVTPSLQDAACAFYPQPPPAFCGTCPPETLCAPDATCQPMPAPLPGVTLTLSAGEEQQVFASWGSITLPGRTFAVALTWDGGTVTLGPTAVPAPLENATLTLSDSRDEPMALDVTWTPPADGGGTVFTRIPINHHAASSTFTDCAVPASTGSLHVGHAMLAPLAVETGLEFQGIEHARFAAAETPVGCVQIRFFVKQIF